VQTSIVRVNGRRGALLTVMRNGKASTLRIVDGVKQALPRILAGLTSELQVGSCSTSPCSYAAVNGVSVKPVTAAALTGLMILMFLEAGAAL